MLWVLLFTLVCSATGRAILPPGFTLKTVGAVERSSRLAAHPDGRVVVLQQEGVALAFDASGTKWTYLSVSVNASFERGLLGMAFAPDFASTKHVFVFYTASSPVRNRVSRFTESAARVLDSATEQVILELPLSFSDNNNGGCLRFSPYDNLLYVSVGDGGGTSNGVYSQNLDSLLGKILRINLDGSAVSSNPFFNASGPASASRNFVYHYGLRNPFWFDFDPAAPHGILLHDPGNETWEEIDLINSAGSNLGWPQHEGPQDCVGGGGLVCPFYWYNHADGSCVITGGAIYNPVQKSFPTAYHGKHFFCDYCGQYIKYLTIGQNETTTFALSTGYLVDLLAHSSTGDLYVLTASELQRITFGSMAGATHIAFVVLLLIVMMI